MDILLDVMGRAVVKGDFVAYGVRDGNSGGLRVGIITDTDQEKGKVQVLTYDHRRKRIDKRKSRPTVRNMIILETTGSISIDEQLIEIMENG